MKMVQNADILSLNLVVRLTREQKLDPKVSHLSCESAGTMYYKLMRAGFRAAKLKTFPHSSHPDVCKYSGS